MNDLKLIKLALARTASETEINSKDRKLLERLIEHIKELEGKRG